MAVMNVFCKILRVMVVLWLGVTLVVPSLHGIVLCIDSHGHVAIEPEHQGQGCCQDHEEEAGASAKYSEAVFISVASGHGCGDCIDLPLSTDNISLLIKNTDRNGLVKVKPIMVVDDMSAVMNRGELRLGLFAPFYERPTGRSHLLVMQKITVLRV